MKSTLLIGMCIVLSWSSLSYGDDNNRLMDKFRIDQSRNIMRPENFGIANGKITTGIDCDDLLHVDGIWAPPYVSSTFMLTLTLDGGAVSHPQFVWHPFEIRRSATLESGVAAETNTLLLPDGRSFLVSLRLTNNGVSLLSVPVNLAVSGTLDKMLDDSSWGFSAPQSTSATQATVLGDHSVALLQGEQAIVLAASDELAWNGDDGHFQGTIALAPKSSMICHLSIAVGATDEATAQCATVISNPEGAIAHAEAVYDQRVSALFQKLPRLTSDNETLVKFYDRSLVPLLMNRWDVPEFKLKPFYATGSVRGGCVGDYLWNLGECAEILPLFDPAGTRAHIRQFLETGVKAGFGFCPIEGTMLHANYYYPINQEKIIGLVYHYVLNTGDVGFLSEALGESTVLDGIISEAFHLDDVSKPVSMVDYGTCDPQGRGGQSHLELRTPPGALNYTNVMPDLNGRRYLNYVLAARLAEVAGKPQEELRERAGALKAELKKQLWNADQRWFDYKIPNADPPFSGTRYTVQMFYLLGSGVLDDEEEAGLLSHLNESEFLSEFGLHSLGKPDPAYFQPDVDNGGPGSCTCFPLNIARSLYGMGKASYADDMLRRILWWGERMPYWGDSFYADTMRYREETPLQCTIDSVTGAQCIIFGMFGIHPEFDGSIRVKPVLPAFAKRISLSGIQLRGQIFDVAVEGNGYTVRYEQESIQARFGQTVLIKNGALALE